MKKFLTAFIFLLCSWVSAQQNLSPSPEQLTHWENFKAVYGNAWQIEWDVTGTPKMIHGTSTPPQTGDPQAIATSFLNQLKDVFGFSSVQQNLLYSGTQQTPVDTFILNHVRFQPHLNGIPILDSRISVHINKKGEIYLVNAMAYRFSSSFDFAAPLLTSEAAQAVALLNIEQPAVLAGEITTKLGYVYKNDTYILVWRVIIPTEQPNHDWQIDIAQDGTIINKRDLIRYADGETTVYLHHPLVGDTVRKSIYSLTEDTCSVKGFIGNVSNVQTDRACSWEIPRQFIYDPSDPRFDEGNVYYHIQYFVQRLQSLGFYIHKNLMEAKVREEGNEAFYRVTDKSLHFGRGCATVHCDTTYHDLAKEEAVIYHEYTHYVEDTLLGPEIGGFIDSIPESEALSEGLADYFAVSASDDPLLLEWSRPADLRRNAVNNLIYPDSMVAGDPYHNGQIISGACWTMRNLINLLNEGRHPDKLALVALDMCEANENFAGFWNLLVVADRQIGYSDDQRAIHLGFFPRWDTTRPANTNPVIDSGPYFSPEEPSTVYEGGSYTLCVDAVRNGLPDGSGGSWLLAYYWKSKYVPISMSYSIDQCVYYSPPILNQTRVDSIWCWIYDGLGGVDSAVKVVTIYPPPPPGGGGSCPHLYVWDGSGFEEDNTFLTQSEYSAKEQKVTDYYLLTKTLIPENSQYLLQVREKENEKTFLDNIELLTVDHPKDRPIGVSSEGKVFYLDENLILNSARDDKGEDQLDKVCCKDGIKFESNTAGYLELTFSNSGNDKLSRMGFVSPSPTKPPNPWAPGPGSLKPPLKVEVQDLSGNWIELADSPPRDNPASAFWLIDESQVQLDRAIKVRISWQKSYTADEIKFYSVSDQTPAANTISLATASHSNSSSVMNLLNSEDHQFATLVRGEKLDLFFLAENLPLEKGYTRSFIVKASGYYIPYASEPSVSVPDRFELKENFPNPFNASTEISYSLPVEAEVKLAIYNIKGQKVKTLVDGRQMAGVHKVTWDGRNDKGEAVASGVYFYSIKSGAYTKTNKMTLLK